MGRDAFFGHLVHFFGADLHLEGVALLGDDGGVQRLVEIVARDGDEVLDASGHRPPLAMNDAQHRVTVGFRLGDDAQRQHVVDLVHRNALPLQLLPDAVDALDARFHPRLDLVLAQLLLDDLLHLGQKRLAFLAAGFDGVLHLVVGDGIDVLEGQVFQFAADLAHAQAVRDGRVDVQGFARDLLLAFLRQKLQRAHVVQAVGQLDEHHANVIHHGQHHLAHVLGLRLFGGGEFDLADLGDAFDDVRDLLAELGLDLVHRDRGVLDGVVQQSGGDGGGVEPHLGQQDGDLERMRKVGLARLANLSFVMLLGEIVGLTDEDEVFFGPVGADLAQEIAEACYCKNIGRDLLAQSRHIRLYDEVLAASGARTYQNAADCGTARHCGQRVMRILISGASGLIGSAVARALHASGDEPVALVRRPARAGEVQWDPRQPLDPAKLSGCDAVVHLAGKNIAGYWTAKFKHELRDSRVQGTETIAKAAAESYRRGGQPQAFLCASGIGYYGNRGDELLTEDSPIGEGFLPDLSREWEAAATPAREAGVRVVNLRFGIVLAPNGGALKPMLLPFRLGLGGRIGDGQQYWSWISLDDVVGVILFALRNDSVIGPINVVSPEPARNEEFVRTLGEVLHRPTIFPLPAFVVRTLMGEMGETALLGSTRVDPAKLKAAGYQFQHPCLKDALQAALRDEAPLRTAE